MGPALGFKNHFPRKNQFHRKHSLPRKRASLRRRIFPDGIERCPKGFWEEHGCLRKSFSVTAKISELHVIQLFFHVSAIPKTLSEIIPRHKTQL
jgi:hypothetical protein